MIRIVLLCLLPVAMVLGYGCFAGDAAARDSRECARAQLDYTRIGLKTDHYLKKNDHCLSPENRRNPDCHNYKERRKQAVANVSDLAVAANQQCGREVAIVECVLQPWPEDMPNEAQRLNSEAFSEALWKERGRDSTYEEMLKLTGLPGDKHTLLAYRCTRLKIERERNVINWGRGGSQ